MKGNSDNYPKIIEKSNNKTQIRYNITEITIIDMNDESRICYNFEYVEIEGELTRNKIITAIIANIYSIDAEIALINNKIEILDSNSETEYQDYQILRALAKTVADDAGYTNNE
jgi:hypothetical protein